MNALKAVVYKQLLDTIKNPMVPMCLLMFPLMTIMFSTFYSEETLKYLVGMYIGCHLSMNSILITSSAVAEETEKGTLRFFTMNGVLPSAYLIGVGGVIFIEVFLSFIPFLVLLGINGWLIEPAPLIFVAAIIVIISEILGMVIGIICRAQIKSNPVASLFSFLLGFAPMLSAMNEDLKDIAGYLYITPIYKLTIDNTYTLDNQEIAVMLGSFVVVVLLFSILFRSSKSFE